tara:strand:- start:174 stop:341 length:168 start_codon:yes stop_codon:yes gene_type:complete
MADFQARLRVAPGGRIAAMAKTQSGNRESGPSGHASSRRAAVRHKPGIFQDGLAH